MTLERTIEKKFTERAKKEGWISLKLTSEAGIPDRIFLKNGKVFFVEFKRSSKIKPDPLQQYQIDRLQKAGFIALTVNDENHPLPTI